IEALESGFRAADERHDDISVPGFGRIFDQDHVALADVILDHRVPTDPQGIRILVTYEIREADAGLFIPGFDRPARRDRADKRYLERGLHAVAPLLLEISGRDINGPALVVSAAQIALFLQGCDVFVHG